MLRNRHNVPVLTMFNTTRPPASSQQTVTDSIAASTVIKKCHTCETGLSAPRFFIWLRQLAQISGCASRGLLPCTQETPAWERSHLYFQKTGQCPSFTLRRFCIFQTEITQFWDRHKVFTFGEIHSNMVMSWFISNLNYKSEH